MSQSSQNIENSVQEICLNDPKSFEQLYNLYARQVYRICFLNTKDADIAKEMVQDIFSSLWERRDSLVITDSWERYLYRAAKLKVLQFTRNNISRKQHMECALQEYCEIENCTEDKIFYNNLSEKVNALVDTLPCKCREVYRMSREKGMNIKEIASTLLISEKTAKNHLNKALSFLKENLSEYKM